MNRLIIISTILVVALTLSIGSIVYTSNASEKIGERIDNIETSIKNNDNKIIIEQIDELSKFWDKKELVLSTFVRHDEVEKVALCIVTMRECAQNELYGELAIQLSQTRFYLNHILKNEQPTYDNIL